MLHFFRITLRSIKVRARLQCSGLTFPVEPPRPHSSALTPTGQRGGGVFTLSLLFIYPLMMTTSTGFSLPPQKIGLTMTLYFLIKVTRRAQIHEQPFSVSQDIRFVLQEWFLRRLQHICSFQPDGQCFC